MKFLYKLLTFALTLILSLTAFAFTEINFSATMRDLLAVVQQFQDLPQESWSDGFTLWIHVFLQPTLIVFVGFCILMRILLGIVSWFFGLGVRRPARAEASAPSSEPFGRWG